MKRWHVFYGLGVLLALSVSFAIITNAQTPIEAGNTTYVGTGIQEIMPFGNAVAEGTGWFFLPCDTNGIGAAAAYDTTGPVTGVERWARAAITYKGRLHDGATGFQTIDSVGYRIRFQWSTDGYAENWVTKDSTAAITDTLYHTDTMIVWPYRMLRLVAHTDTSAGLPSQDYSYRQLVGFTIYPVPR